MYMKCPKCKVIRVVPTDGSNMICHHFTPYDSPAVEEYKMEELTPAEMLLLEVKQCDIK